MLRLNPFVEQVGHFCHDNHALSGMRGRTFCLFESKLCQVIRYIRDQLHVPFHPAKNGPSTILFQDEDVRVLK